MAQALKENNHNLKRRLFNLYKGCPLSTRLYLRQRWVPFQLCEKLASYIPGSGKILDLGCGYGIFSNYLALKSREREILGIDCIRERIGIAQKVSSGKFNGRLEFRTADIRSFDIGPKRYECIILADVLCYISFEERLQLLERCYSGLKENGVLLIKDFNNRPILKYGLFYFSDYLMNRFRVLFLNPDWKKAFNGRLFVRNYREEASTLEKIGYLVEVIPLYTYESGIIYICRKAGNGYPG